MNAKKKERKPVEYRETKPIKTDARYRYSVPATIANESLAEAMGIRGTDVGEQLIIGRMDEQGRILIANYDLGFEISLDKGIASMTDEDLLEISKIRDAHAEKASRREKKRSQVADKKSHEEGEAEADALEEETSAEEKEDQSADQKEKDSGKGSAQEDSQKTTETRKFDPTKIGAAPSLFEPSNNKN